MLRWVRYNFVSYAQVASQSPSHCVTDSTSERSEEKLLSYSFHSLRWILKSQTFLFLYNSSECKIRWQVGKVQSPWLFPQVTQMLGSTMVPGVSVCWHSRPLRINRSQCLQVFSVESHHLLCFGIHWPTLTCLGPNPKVFSQFWKVLSLGQ